MAILSCFQDFFYSLNDIVKAQLKRFMEDKLVFERSIDGRKSSHYTELGKVVFVLFTFA
jgi:hypothetical protein